MRDNLIENPISNQLISLIRWSILRHKHLLVVFSFAQIVLSLAIVYGLALMLPDIDEETAIYLSSGSITLGIIAVGCVLSGQIINTAKQEGIIYYQKTLPVYRLNIIFADIIIWGLASLPGIFMSCLAAIFRFHLTIEVSIQCLLAIAIIQISMICIGFAIAYWFSANIVALVTQIIMIGGLLFSPILYPTNRLPIWTKVIYENLPFVPASKLIRSTLFNNGTVSIRDVVVVSIWGIVTMLLSLIALSRRE
ncbi:ABC transporter permease [Niallia taxi]|uniref:ABC transporter permease n=1 Tax=Niallia TaxID=2837506 RepID=UPI0030F5FB88